MDLVNQNKFKNSLIFVLLTLNLLTVSIIWMQTANRNDARPIEPGKRSSESVDLMKKTLDLDEEQTKELEKIRTDQIDQSKKYNDSLNLLKEQLAKELFKAKPDTLFAAAEAKKIGELQTKVEIVRFKHFNELIALCTPEQKEKLKPILVELFGRKPPKYQSPSMKQPMDSSKPEDRPEKIMSQQNNTLPVENNFEKRTPPSIDEKLEKYSRRLNLTEEQKEKVRTLLTSSRQKDQKLRDKVNPERNEVEIEKGKIKSEEDDGIMKILDENQKKEFSKMILNRKK